MLGAGHDASVTVRLSSRGAAGAPAIPPSCRPDGGKEAGCGAVGQTNWRFRLRGARMSEGLPADAIALREEVNPNTQRLR